MRAKQCVFEPDLQVQLRLYLRPYLLDATLAPLITVGVRLLIFEFFPSLYALIRYPTLIDNFKAKIVIFEKKLLVVNGAGGSFHFGIKQKLF